MPEYFTLPELRALPDLSDTVAYPDARCELVAAFIVAIIERTVGTSFVARTVTAEIHDGGVDGIVLASPFARTITSASESGVAVTDTLSVRAGVLERRSSATATSPTRWESGTRNVSVTYTAGYSATPPGDVKEAALQATRLRLMATDSNARGNQRRTSTNNEMGAEQFVVAGVERPTGYPDIDAVIIGWRDKLNVYGFA